MYCSPTYITTRLYSLVSGPKSRDQYILITTTAADPILVVGAETVMVAAVPIAVAEATEVAGVAPIAEVGAAVPTPAVAQVETARVATAAAAVADPTVVGAAVVPIPVALVETARVIVVVAEVAVPTAAGVEAAGPIPVALVETDSLIVEAAEATGVAGVAPIVVGAAAVPIPAVASVETVMVTVGAAVPIAGIEVAKIELFPIQMDFAEHPSARIAADPTAAEAAKVDPRLDLILAPAVPAHPGKHEQHELCDRC